MDEYYKKYNKIYIVVSAIKDVTNNLLSAIYEPERAMDIITEIYDRHVKILSKFTNGKIFESSFRELSKLVDELYKVMWSVRVIDEITTRVKDYILSFGERMSVVLLSAILKNYGFDVEGKIDPPFITDENYGEANVIENLTLKNLENIKNLKNKIVVLPGFIGKSIHSKFTTLGRGGSDYTATLLGKLIGSKEVRLITEVPGIMTADPKKFKNARTIPRLSLEEAIELSQLGAKKLHPRTFEPLFGVNMKVIIEGLYEPGFTVVEGECSKEDTLKGIAKLEDLVMINIESMKMVGRVGSAATIFSEAKNAGVNIIAISQPASETSIQVVVKKSDAELLVKSLQNLQSVLIKDITLTDVEAVSVVGCGLKFNEVNKEVMKVISQYEIQFLSRGLKNTSITFITNKEEGDKLANELHEVVLKWIR
ncbi:MAG: aspartate kinase [Sulfolobaceae archaeon]